MTNPQCQGIARFDTEKQARYVAQGHTHEFGTLFVHIQHDDHWHVVEATPQGTQSPSTDHKER